MDQQPPNEAQPDYETLKQEFIDLLRDLAEQGVDFSENDLPWILEMDEAELTGFVIGLLDGAGVVEPEAYLESLGFFDKVSLLSTAELEARNSRKLRAEGYRVAELDQQDLEPEGDT